MRSKGGLVIFHQSIAVPLRNTVIAFRVQQFCNAMRILREKIGDIPVPTVQHNFKLFLTVCLEILRFKL